METANAHLAATLTGVACCMSGDTFGDTRVKKHGPLWKTNILGAPTVMVYDEVDVKAVLAAEGKTAAVTWPDATAQLVGPASLNLLTPPRQTAVKAVFMKAFSDRTCQQYIARMVEATQAVLDVWVHAHHTAAQQAQDTGSSGAQVCSKPMCRHMFVCAAGYLTEVLLVLFIVHVLVTTRQEGDMCGYHHVLMHCTLLRVLCLTLAPNLTRCCCSLH